MQSKKVSLLQRRRATRRLLLCGEHHPWSDHQSALDQYQHKYRDQIINPLQSNSQLHRRHDFKLGSNDNWDLSCVLFGRPEVTNVLSLMDYLHYMEKIVNITAIKFCIKLVKRILQHTVMLCQSSQQGKHPEQAKPPHARIISINEDLTHWHIIIVV